ncbi:uncharacterized protein LOC117103883 isoform X2 [Anneissia japonica]|nr:uncharacterized protein LOC117103883 isoform X2 [Anneissia japonica]
MCPSFVNMQQPPFPQAHENMDQSQYHYQQGQAQSQHPQQPQPHPQQQQQQQPQHPQQHPQQDVQHQNQYYYPQFPIKQEPTDYFPSMLPNGYVNSMYSNDLSMNVTPHNGMHMNGVYNGNMPPMNNGYPRNGFHIKQEPIYCNNPNQMLNPAGQQLLDPTVPTTLASATTTTKKKGKSKKVKQETLTDAFPVKKRRKVDRFNGMPEEEVAKRILPDHLKLGLDIMIIGINPGLFAAYKGHHYAGPGNHFWKCLYLSGLIPEPMTAMDDYKLLDFGIGFTNIVERTSRGSADLTKKEIKEGAKILLEKVKQFKPKIAVFNGKGIYEVFNGSKNFEVGRQPEPMEGTDTVVYVMPSSSARCSQFPRAQDKVKFYLKLKELREELTGSPKSVTNKSTEEQQSSTIQEAPAVNKDGEEAIKAEGGVKDVVPSTKVEENQANDKKPEIKIEPRDNDNIENMCAKKIEVKLEKNVDGTIPASNLCFLKNEEKNAKQCTPPPQNGHVQKPVQVKQEPKENPSEDTESSSQLCSLSQRMLQTASWVQSLPSLPIGNRFEDQIPNISNPQRSQYFQSPHGSMGYYPPQQQVPQPPQQMNDPMRMNQHMTSGSWLASTQQMMMPPHHMGGHPPMTFTQSLLGHSTSISQPMSTSLSNLNTTSVVTSQQHISQPSSR